MNLNAKLADSQREILNEVIARELQVAGLYDQFAEAFTEYSDLWSDLADEERMHAELLQRMDVYIDEGKLLWHLGELKNNDLFRREEQMFRDLAGKLGRGALSIQEALMAGVRIESSIVDAQFFKTVFIDLPEFAELSAKIQEEEHVHIGRIKSALVKIV